MLTSSFYIADDCFQSSEARRFGVDYFPHFETATFLKDLDVVILSVPMIDFEECVASLPSEQLAGKLLVDVCPLNLEPRKVMLKAFKDVPDVDILVTNPMFGAYIPNDGETLSSNAVTDLWSGRPMVYERVRVSNMQRCDRYLKIFEEARCQVIEMASDQHDSSTADAEFITHMVGRLLDPKLLPPTPVMSKEYSALSDVAEMTSGDSFDMFFGMYKYNDRAKDHLATMRENLASIERQLAGREAYLAAKTEMRKSDRQRLLAETRLLLQELAKSSALGRNVEESKEEAVMEIQEIETMKDIALNETKSLEV
jgi:prephenate dehydrogenase